MTFCRSLSLTVCVFSCLVSALFSFLNSSTVILFQRRLHETPLKCKLEREKNEVHLALFLLVAGRETPSSFFFFFSFFLFFFSDFDVDRSAEFYLFSTEEKKKTIFLALVFFFFSFLINSSKCPQTSAWIGTPCSSRARSWPQG